MNGRSQWRCGVNAICAHTAGLKHLPWTALPDTSRASTSRSGWSTEWGTTSSPARMVIKINAINCFYAIFCICLNFPRVLSSNSTITKIKFEKEGRLFVTKQYLHIILHVNTSVYLDSCKQLGQHASSVHDEILRQFPDAHESQDPTTIMVLKKLNSTKLHLQQTCTSVKNIPYGLEREKRQLALAALGFTAGTAFGYFGEELLARIGHHHGTEDKIIQALHQDESRLLRVQEEIHGLQGHLRQLQRGLKQSEVLRQLDFFDSCVRDFTTHANLLVEGSIGLYQQRLTSHLVRPQQLQTVMREAKLYAASVGANLPYQKVDQLYQLPASFLPSPTGIQAIIHVPLVTREMQLMRLTDAYVLHRERNESALLVIRAPKSLLAYDTTQQYFLELDAEDLTHCLSLGSTHFCEQTTLQRDLTSSCLGSLYLGHLPAVRAECQLIRQRQQWFVLREAEEKVLAYSARPLPYHQKCSNGSTYGRILHGLQPLHLPAQCTLESTLFLVDLSIRPRVVQYHVDAEWDAVDVVAPLTIAELYKWEEVPPLGRTQDEEALVELLRRREVEVTPSTADLIFPSLCIINLILCVCIYAYVFFRGCGTCKVNVP
jgi:hypothetical protein